MRSQRYFCPTPGLSCAGVFGMRPRLLATCVLLGLSCSVAHGQGGKSGAPKSAGTISTTSRNVVLDVIVTDKNGKPIRGLKAQDFMVAEDGKRQQVKGFEEHRPDVQASK